MNERSREKIALVVFALLVAFALFALGSYLVAGHSWNVAASNIDDSIGSMDGYTAIVYEGTVDEKAEAAKKRAEEAAKKAAGDDAAASGEASPDAAATEGAAPDAVASTGEAAPDAVAASVPDDVPADADATPEDTDGPEGADAPAEPDETSETDASGSSDAALAGDDASDAATGDAAPASPAEPTAALDAVDAKDPVSVEEAQESYEDKGATVLALRSDDLPFYHEGLVLKRGTHRFGVFSVEKPTSHLVLERQVAAFEKQQVDFIVALTSDKDYLDGIPGVDIVISTKAEGLFAMGETIDGTFYVGAPSLGSVGAILISLSNVVSAKTISEL